jgi:hypothetical protein
LPPLSPQSLPPPSPSQQPLEPADHGDDVVGGSKDGNDGSGDVGSITEGEGGVGGEAGPGGGGGDGEDDGGSEEEDDDDDGDDYEFDQDIVFDDSTNPHGLEFLYSVFQGCTPHFPVNEENIWRHSRVDWKDYMGAKAARVARKPAPHLLKFLATFDSVHDARMAFTVYQQCIYLRYVLRQDGSGLVVVKVESVSENDGDDWSKTATIRRVMSTKHAIEQCSHKISKELHLGRNDLETFQGTLEQYQRDHKPWTVGYEVYHESDIVEEVDIRELIGVVRCYPFRSAEAPEMNHFRAPYDEYLTADLIYIGEPFRQSFCRKLRRSS